MTDLPPLTTIYALAEDEVTKANIEKLFKQASKETSLDKDDEDDELKVFTEGLRIFVTINPEVRLLRFICSHRSDEEDRTVGAEIRVPRQNEQSRLHGSVLNAGSGTRVFGGGLLSRLR